MARFTTDTRYPNLHRGKARCRIQYRLIKRHDATADPALAAHDSRYYEAFAIVGNPIGYAAVRAVVAGHAGLEFDDSIPPSMWADASPDYFRYLEEQEREALMDSYRD